MLHPALIFSLLPLVHATCPASYNNQNGYCFQVFNQKKTRNDAATACAQDGAYLASIPNAFMNTMIQQGATQVTEVWIGLKCEANSYQSCKYDNSNGYLDADYTNFALGYPSIGIGECVYMSTAGSFTGQWFSAGCADITLGYACLYDGTSVNGCSSGYSLYNNECYKVIPAKDEPSAEAECEADCGYITSILSHDENVFVRSFAYNSSVRNLAQIYARIGLKANVNTGQYYWEDGTSLSTYQNFGLRNTALGYCVAMALQNDVVNAGEWMNTDCSLSLISVCKKNVGDYCHSTPPSGTLSPVQCDGSYQYYNNDTIYSPGYPGLTIPNKCDYLMIAPVGYVVRIKFPSLMLDCDSQIELYNYFTDTTPFSIITNRNSPGPTTYYYSKENYMKMIFVAINGITCATGDKWAAQFEFIRQDQITTTTAPITSGCNQSLLMAPGSITSPNYPLNYPNNMRCEYRLGAATNRHVNLHFVEIKMDRDDFIRVYDGPDDSYPLLTQPFNSNNPPLPDFISSGNRLFVVFSSDNLNNDKGFFANFTSTT